MKKKIIKRSDGKSGDSRAIKITVKIIILAVLQHTAKMFPIQSVVNPEQMTLFSLDCGHKKDKLVINLINFFT